MSVIVFCFMIVQISNSATIVGTKHDLSTSGPNSTLKGGTDICVYCHTPHGASSTSVALWNRAALTTVFTLYSSETLQAVPGQPGGVSSACLSCHDGTLGVDAYGKNTGTSTKKITGDAALGTDLTNDHPISFTYDAALAISDPGLVSPTSDKLVVAGVPLFASKLECASCHNVHDNTNSPFLRVSNVGSALCLKCHKK
jgi:predicted CXXCH cytochrome family protein